MTTKRQHYVPQFYLENFVENPGAKTPTFWVYDKEDGACRRQTPVNTAIEGHLYSLDFPDGRPTDFLERQLAGVEGVSKPILERWCKPGAIPTQEEIVKIAHFLGAMHVRVPRNIVAVGEYMAGYFRAWLVEHGNDEAKFRELWDDCFAGKPEAAGGMTFDETRAFMSDPDRHLRINTNPKVAMAFSLLMVEDAVQALLSFNWCLCRLPRGTFFITSDCPLNVFIMCEPGVAQFGPGLLLPGTEVFFPVSPEVGLSLDRIDSRYNQSVDAHFVYERNRRIACMAERFVISPHQMDVVRDLVAEYAHTRERPKLDRDELRREWTVAGGELASSPSPDVEIGDVAVLLEKAGEAPGDALSKRK